MRTYDAVDAIFQAGDAGPELDAIRTSGYQAAFSTGVVYEYITSPLAIPIERQRQLETLGVNLDLLASAPPNALIIRPTDNAIAHLASELIVCFPFFPHILQPVKPGETVWYFSWGEQANSGKKCFWLSRVVLPREYEDANYSHHDRQYFPVENTTYPNGAGDETSLTVPGNLDEFDRIVSESYSRRLFLPSATPRPVGSPNATGIYGSHRNRLRCDVFDGAGFSEITAGLPKPRSRQSSRDWEETNRSGFFSDESPTASPLDGSAKFWVSERLRSPDTTLRFAQLDLSTGLNGAPIPQAQGSACFAKADHARIRGDVSVRIRGGNSDVSIQDGQIALSAEAVLLNSRRIVVGRGEDLDLRLGGADASQALVLGDALAEWQGRLVGTLQGFLRDLNGVQVPTPGGPVPLGSLPAASGVVSTITQRVIADLDTLLSERPRHLSAIAKVNSKSKE